MDETRRQHEQRPFDRLQGVRIEPLDGGGIRIKLRAFGPVFARAFDGIHAELQLCTPGTTPISGRLSLLPSKEPRGTWYDHRFDADDPAALSAVSFVGLNHDSNIVALVLHGQRSVRLANPFCRKAASS